MANNRETHEIKLVINGQEIPNSYKDLQKAQRSVKNELKGLEVGTDKYIKKSMELKQINKQLDTVRKDINKVGSAWRKQQSMWTQAKSVFAGTFAALSVQGAIGKIQDLGSQVIQFIKDLSKNRKEITRLTAVTGADLDITSAKIQSVVDTYDKEFNEVLIASNSLAKSMDISIVQALEHIQTGFAAGADINGEFLNILKEYPAQFKAAGLSAEQSIAVITQQVKEGIYSDKGVDTIKEGTLRLREMNKATREAIDGIGLSSQEMEDKLKSGSITYFEAMQMVSGKLSDIEAQSPGVGAAIADIFGGAGEDAGLDYIKSLAKIQLSLENVDSESSRLLKANERLNMAYQKFADDDGFLGRTQLMFTNLKASILETINGSDNLIQSLKDEQNELNVLVNSIQNVNEDEEVRLGLINELKEKYPDFLSNLSAEKITNQDLTTALKEANQEYYRRIILQESDEKISKVVSRQLENYQNLLQVEKEIAVETGREGRAAQLRKNRLLAEREALTKEIRQLQEEQDLLIEQFAPSSTSSNKSASTKTPGSTSSTTASRSSKETLDITPKKEIDLGVEALVSGEDMKSKALKEGVEYRNEARDLEIAKMQEQREAQIELTAQSSILAGLEANSAEERADAIKNAITGEIKALIAKAIATVITNTLVSAGITGPFALVIAGAAGAAAGALISSAIPSFHSGGFTGYGDKGLGSNEGGFVRGTVEEGEYVLNKDMLRDPYVANVARYIEDSKKFGQRSSPGSSSISGAKDINLEVSEFKGAIAEFNNIVQYLSQNGIKVNSRFTRKSFRDAFEDLGVRESTKDRGKL